MTEPQTVAPLAGRSLRIILLMLEPPLPFGGAPARWYYVLLKGLVERGHRVSALATCSNSQDIARCAEFFPTDRYDLKCFAHPRRSGVLSKWRSFRRPYSYMFSDDLERELDRHFSGGFDIFHVEQLWGAWTGLAEINRMLVNVHHLMNIDLGEVRPPTFTGRRAQSLMLKTEDRLLRRLRWVRSCSPRLVPLMKSLNPSLDVSVVPVGMDPAQYDYIPDEMRTSEPVISVIGTMNWYPTHSAAVRLLERLWPAIRRRVPGARAQIVGWGARSALARYIGMPDVTIEENVPDIRPYFERTGVLLYAPSRGSGMKIKIVEALGFGVPVVTTSEGIEGLPAQDGVHVGLCEDDEGLIERAVALLSDRQRQDAQRAAGRGLFQQHCSPATTLDAIESIYARMLAQGSR